MDEEYSLTNWKHSRWYDKEPAPRPLVPATCCRTESDEFLDGKAQYVNLTACQARVDKPEDWPNPEYVYVQVGKISDFICWNCSSDLVLIAWLIDWVNDRLVDWLNEGWAEWVSSWLLDWLIRNKQFYSFFFDQLIYFFHLIIIIIIIIFDLNRVFFLALPRAGQNRGQATRCCPRICRNFDSQFVGTINDNFFSYFGFSKSLAF